MKAIRGYLKEGKSRWLESRYRRPVPIVLDEPIISICFDDVPQSTLLNGVPLLNKYGVKATFYACLNLPEDARVLGIDALKKLHMDGHEIGCHTSSHYSLHKGSVEGLAEDARENRELFMELFKGFTPSSFAFPFGHLSHKAKHALSPNYETLRSGRAGINKDTSDFNCLRAISLEWEQFNEVFINGWLDMAENKLGWVIFYTHGVTNTPTTYDLKPEMLNLLLNAISLRKYKVLPVAKAAESIKLKSLHHLEYCKKLMAD